jgi:hypothetical protein
MVSKHLKQQNSKAARNVPRSNDCNVGTELILLLVHQLTYLSGVGVKNRFEWLSADSEGISISLVQKIGKKDPLSGQR